LQNRRFLETQGSVLLLGRLTIFGYGLVCHAVFLATFLYAIGFVGNFFVPRAIDGAPPLEFVTALLIDLALLGLFAVQHGLMARPFFRQWLTRLIPDSAEQSTYVLFSGLALSALIACWQPLGGILWNLESPFARVAMYALFGFGWTLLLVSTFLVNHFDLFGLRQVWQQMAGRAYTPLRSATPAPRERVRPAGRARRRPPAVSRAANRWARPRSLG
jgi:protein-S-isoprenylcysteine O-methyltransferase Ste14